MQTHKEAEQYLFNELRPVLRHYADQPIEELARIGYQTAWAILEDHNTRMEALSLFSKNFIWRKVHRWAEWWIQWHERGRGCQFTKTQTQAGHVRSLRVRRDKASRRAYRAHLLRQYKYSMRQIAAALGVSLGTVHTYLKKPWAALKRVFSLKSLTTCTQHNYTSVSPSPSRHQTEHRPVELSTSYPQTPLSGGSPCTATPNPGGSPCYGY